LRLLRDPGELEVGKVGIFRKDKTEPVISTATQEAAARPVPARPATQPRKEKTVSLKTDEITTILGKGSEFEGKLQFEGTLRIEGVYSGEIISDSVLVVGEGAKVDAEIDIGTIIINGQVTGNVRAKQGVEIRGAGRLQGNIHTPSLYIEKGVTFDGNCKMGDPGKKQAVFSGPATPDKPGVEVKDNSKDKK